MSHARKTTLTFSVMFLSPVTSEVYCLVDIFEKPIHDAVRHFSFLFFFSPMKYLGKFASAKLWVNIPLIAMAGGM